MNRDKKNKSENSKMCSVCGVRGAVGGGGGTEMGMEGRQEQNKARIILGSLSI